MKKYTIPAVMKFNPTRKGARFEYAGKAYNAGEAVECAIGLHFDGHWEKDHIAFDAGSDVETIDASVKSYKATLVSPSLMKATDFDGIVNEYFARVHSTRFIWGAEVNGEILCYEMNKNEFYKFVTSGLWKMDSSRGSVRQAVCSAKVIAWMESQV